MEVLFKSKLAKSEGSWYETNAADVLKYAARRCYQVTYCQPGNNFKIRYFYGLMII